MQRAVEGRVGRGIAEGRRLNDTVLWRDANTFTNHGGCSSTFLAASDGRLFDELLDPKALTLSLLNDVTI